MNQTKNHSLFINEFSYVDSATVLDILQNCSGNEIEARKQILFIFGENGNDTDTVTNTIKKEDSWGEIPQINDLDNEFSKPINTKIVQKLKSDEYSHRDETTEHINSYLYGPKDNTSGNNYSITEKDPPVGGNISKNKRKNRKRNKKKNKKKKIL